MPMEELFSLHSECSFLCKLLIFGSVLCPQIYSSPEGSLYTYFLALFIHIHASAHNRLRKCSSSRIKIVYIHIFLNSNTETCYVGPLYKRLKLFKSDSFIGIASF